jgi:hypothetical protein
MSRVKFGTGVALKVPVIRYLFRDDLTDTRVAGAVNGTPPTPGPGGNRVATDTGGQLSIDGAGATFGPTGGAFGDPGLWYSAQSRVAGRILVATVTLPAGASIDAMVGWDNGQSGSPGLHSFYFTTVGLRINNNASVFTVGAFTYNATHRIAIIARAAGADYFARMAGSDNWLLMYAHDLAGTTPMYPAFGKINATAVRTVTIRIPDAFWLPAPLASDGFGSAFGTTDGLGHAEGVTGGIGSGGGGVTWTQRLGTWGISGGKAVATALDGSGAAIATIPTSTPDVLAYAKLTWVANSLGPVVRYTDISNYVYAVHDGTNAKLVKRVAGTETVLINASATYSAGADAVIVPSGTKFRLYYNNAFIDSEKTISDAALQSGDVGIISKSTSNSIDDFRVYARGTSGEYSTLGQYL